MDLDRHHFDNMRTAYNEALEKLKAESKVKMNEEFQSKKFVGTPEMQAQAREAEKKRLESIYEKKYIEDAKSFEGKYWEECGGSQQAAFNSMMEHEKEIASYENDTVETPNLGKDFENANGAETPNLGRDFDNVTDMER